jgi:hypothetical protein
MSLSTNSGHWLVRAEVVHKPRGRHNLSRLNPQLIADDLAKLRRHSITIPVKPTQSAQRPNDVAVKQTDGLQLRSLHIRDFDSDMLLNPYDQFNGIETHFRASSLAEVFFKTKRT